MEPSESDNTTTLTTTNTTNIAGHDSSNLKNKTTPATSTDHNVPKVTLNQTSEPEGTAATSQEAAFIDRLIDDVIFCECLQVHRAAKMGFIFTEPGDEMYRIKDGHDVDVFGQPLAKAKKQLNCTCPQCGRNLGASRMAAHLEKCMGMGRLSSRTAATNKRDLA